MTVASVEDMRAPVLAALNEQAAEAHRMSAGSFRDLCLAIEVGLLHLAQSTGLKATKLVIGFTGQGDKTAITVEDVELAKGAGAPADWAVEGLWAVLYSMCMPRMTPFAKDPFCIRRITVAHGVNPTVEYDREQDMGIPLSLDRPYDAKRAQAALQASSVK